MKRRPTQELLDTDFGTPAEVAASLRDLRSFNSHLGGVTTIRELIRSVVQQSGKKHLSLLDLAAGDGFLPGRAARELIADGITLNIVLLDQAATHLPQNGTKQKIVADALQLPFRDCSFDLVSSSLFMHHLSPAQVVHFTRESLRVSRIGVLVHDLIRHSLHLTLAYAGAPIYRSRITRHDAPASVKQAYTVDEMKQLLLESGAKRVDVQTHFLFRMGLMAWK